MVPRKPAEGEPIGCGKRVAGPIAIAASVGHAGDAGICEVIDRAVDDVCDSRTCARAECIGVEAFFPQRGEERELEGTAEVLLRDLEFGGEWRVRHCAEERVEGLARHEVNRAVFHLHENVCAELAIERSELGESLLRAVVWHLMTVDKRPPDDDAAMRSEDISE